MAEVCRRDSSASDESLSLRAVRLLAHAVFVLMAALGLAQAGPLPALSVKDGVILDAGGREVALWGVNYQASLFWEYTETYNLVGIPLEAARLKQAVDEDLAHLKRMGVSIVRVHLSPSDFTDAEGRLVDTVFLDVFDYLVARCRQENLYVFISLFNRIGIRDQANFLKDSFASKGGTNNTPGQPDKRPYIFCPEYAEPFRTYIRALLNHPNRYDGLTLKSDPGVAVWEIMNEPEYLDYEDIQDVKFRAYRAEWKRWLAGEGKKASKETFAEYRGKHVGKFIDEMVDLIRAEGARQPIAWSLNWPGFIAGYPEIHRAIAASKVDAVTFCLYLRKGLPPKEEMNWFDMPSASGVNQLDRVLPRKNGKLGFNFVTTPMLKDKAKIVYEFETVNNDSAYLYPAMARVFRELGAQIACMWEYDPLAAAEENCVPTHFLNYFSSPRKAVSFLIGGEAFRKLPRQGKTEIKHTDSAAVFGDFGVSFDGDISVYAGGDTVMASNDWAKWPRAMREFALPEANAVRRIAGVGRGPFVDYDGTGLYQVEIAGDRVELEITPNVTKVGKLWAAEKVGKRWAKGLAGKVAPKAVLFGYEARDFRLLLPEWSRDVRVTRVDTGEVVPHGEGESLSLKVPPGRYEIRRKGAK
jgi:hypothetical protein